MNRETMRQAALLLIDLQANMFDPANPVKAADLLLANLPPLLERARAARVPVFLVRNCGSAGDPDVRGTPGWELHPSFRPAAGEVVVDKTSSDAFADTVLDEELKRLGVTDLVIAGLQSEYCIRATILGALARGYEVTLVADGHSTYDGEGYSAEEKTAGINAELGKRVCLTSTAAAFRTCDACGGLSAGSLPVPDPKV